VGRLASRSLANPPTRDVHIVEVSLDSKADSLGMTFPIGDAADI
jgi:hypothetical protein